MWSFADGPSPTGPVRKIVTLTASTKWKTCPCELMANNDVIFICSLQGQCGRQKVDGCLAELGWTAAELKQQVGTKNEFNVIL